VTKIVLLGLKSVPLTSRFVGTRGCIFNKGLSGIFHAILSVVGTTADLIRGSDFVHLRRLRQSKMSFHQALNLILELDELATGRLVNGSSCDEIDMVIKDLDLEPKDIVAEFCGPFRWKELSKETSSKILPCGDGSCWKAFKPVASLIAKGKLK
ncbi:hypothetical protein Tco_1259433, partial [Tanacetum coccineum]